MAKSPVSWFGGKGRMVKHILAVMPPHRVYVEPFGGGAHVLFNKEPSSVEVYNDLDSGLVNFFRVIRDPSKVGRLYMLASCTPYSREEYLFCRDTWEECSDDVERAHRWFVVAKMSFSGLFGKSWAMNRGASSKGMGLRVSAWQNAAHLLAMAHERMMRVQIEHDSFLKLIPNYDTPETLFYCDPPYVPSTRRGGVYDHELSLEDHRALVDLLLGMEGMAVLSGYDHPVYRPLEQAGWEKRQFNVVCTAAGQTHGNRLKKTGNGLEHQARTECLWISPRATEARRDAARRAAEERARQGALFEGED